jgi:acetylornithine/succinyldiaminopimelate/putrescine aminotransferase
MALVSLVGPQAVQNLRYTRCTGAELETAEGRTILDFLYGYCVHNSGHNHPYIVQQICRNNFMVLKVAPPLIISEPQIGLLHRIGTRCSRDHALLWTFSDAIKLGRRAIFA